ncbi:SRPBCC family protein [Massilia sp. BJB1822]|nr:SRPBCC family protein [Massilia sp. BJB1822]
MQVEHRISVRTSPTKIFSIYADVSNWHTWDPDTKNAFLNGEFQLGAKGKLTPTKGQTVPMVVTELIPSRSFTVESKIPLFKMVFEHELHPRGVDTEVVHRVTFSGPLKILLGPMLIKQLNVGLPRTLGNLKLLAEKGEIA